jgi:lysozyme
MKLDAAGRQAIYKDEGVRLKAYKDVVGVVTIGVGCTYYPDGRRVQMGDEITQQQCDELFATIVAAFEAAVIAAIKVPLNQNQFNALVSFAYNVGTNAFKNSTLVKQINEGASEAAIRFQFSQWKRAGGKVYNGLLQRRIREANLFFKR